MCAFPLLLVVFSWFKLCILVHEVAVLRSDRLGIVKSQQVPEAERKGSVSTINFDDVLYVDFTGKEVVFKEAYDQDAVSPLGPFLPLKKEGSRFVLPHCIRPCRWTLNLRFEGEAHSSTFIINVEAPPVSTTPAGWVSCFVPQPLAVSLPPPPPFHAHPFDA